MKTKFDVGETVLVPVMVRAIHINKSDILYDLYCEYNITNGLVPENFIIKADNADEQQT
ncbi:MAG: hypothetical protein J6W84_06370 [Bacteroidales bacterium]|nr:hypothetical protein [Bacteroidales bacterium]